ncbi:MAG: hypothetical protein KC561_02530, partial [Myxococcales bacterium]|nr:hypothetical protein [Myxococcales bacterium]
GSGEHVAALQPQEPPEQEVIVPELPAGPLDVALGAVGTGLTASAAATNDRFVRIRFEYSPEDAEISHGDDDTIVCTSSPCELVLSRASEPVELVSHRRRYDTYRFEVTPEQDSTVQFRLSRPHDDDEPRSGRNDSGRDADTTGATAGSGESEEPENQSAGETAAEEEEEEPPFLMAPITIQ